jgi:uncharacterized protein YdaU (DUF1376 family)
MKKLAYYFPHDTNAHLDERIIHLMSVLDWSGYGLYWGIIERLHDSSDGWLENDCPRIAFALHSHPVIINQVLNDFNLFKFDGKRFTSERVQRNLRERKKRSEHGKKAANYRHNKALTENARAMHEQCSPNAIKERKGKEIKEKESITLSAFSAPTTDQVIDYCNERKNGVDPIRFVDFYTAKGWMVGKNKMKDWKAAVRTWEKPKEELPRRRML